MRCVSLDLDAYKIAALTRLYTNRQSQRAFDQKWIAELCEKVSPSRGEIWIDENPLWCPIRSLTDDFAAKIEVFVITELAKIAVLEQRKRGIAGTKPFKTDVYGACNY
jgi:hypothetical protein